MRLEFLILVVTILILANFVVVISFNPIKHLRFDVHITAFEQSLNHIVSKLMVH